MIARLSSSQPAGNGHWAGALCHGRWPTAALAGDGRQGVSSVPARRSTDQAAMAATLWPICNDIAGERHGGTVAEVMNP